MPGTVNPPICLDGLTLLPSGVFLSLDKHAEVPEWVSESPVIEGVVQTFFDRGTLGSVSITGVQLRNMATLARWTNVLDQVTAHTITPSELDTLANRLGIYVAAPGRTDLLSEGGDRYVPVDGDLRPVDPATATGVLAIPESHILERETGVAHPSELATDDAFPVPIRLVGGDQVRIGHSPEVVNARHAEVTEIPTAPEKMTPATSYVDLLRHVTGTTSIRVTPTGGAGTITALIIKDGDGLSVLRETADGIGAATLPRSFDALSFAPLGTAPGTEVREIGFGPVRPVYTTAGLRILHEDDEEHLAAFDTITGNGDYKLAVEGSQGDLLAGGHTWDANLVGDLIKADPAWDGRNITVISCDAGLGFVKELAERLPGVAVTGALGPLWTTAGGDAFVARATLVDSGIRPGLGLTGDSWVTYTARADEPAVAVHHAQSHLPGSTAPAGADATDGATLWLMGLELELYVPLVPRAIPGHEPYEFLPKELLATSRFLTFQAEYKNTLGLHIIELTPAEPFARDGQNFRYALRNAVAAITSVPYGEHRPLREVLANVQDIAFEDTFSNLANGDSQDISMGDLVLVRGGGAIDRMGAQWTAGLENNRWLDWLRYAVHEYDGLAPNHPMPHRMAQEGLALGEWIATEFDRYTDGRALPSERQAVAGFIGIMLPVLGALVTRQLGDQTLGKSQIIMAPRDNPVYMYETLPLEALDFLAVNARQIEDTIAAHLPGYDIAGKGRHELPLIPGAGRPDYLAVDHLRAALDNMLHGAEKNGLPLPIFDMFDVFGITRASGDDANNMARFEFRNVSAHRSDHLNQVEWQTTDIANRIASPTAYHRDLEQLGRVLGQIDSHTAVLHQSNQSIDATIRSYGGYPPPAVAQQALQQATWNVREAKRNLAFAESASIALGQEQTWAVKQRAEQALAGARLVRNAIPVPSNQQFHLAQTSGAHEVPGTESARIAVIDHLRDVVSRNFDDVQQFLRQHETHSQHAQASGALNDLWMRLVIPSAPRTIDLTGAGFAATVNLYRQTRDLLAAIDQDHHLPSIEAELQQGQLVVPAEFTPTLAPPSGVDAFPLRIGLPRTVAPGRRRQRRRESSVESAMAYGSLDAGQAADVGSFDAGRLADARESLSEYLGYGPIDSAALAPPPAGSTANMTLTLQSVAGGAQSALIFKGTDRDSRMISVAEFIGAALDAARTSGDSELRDVYDDVFNAGNITFRFENRGRADIGRGVGEWRSSTRDRRFHGQSGFIVLHPNHPLVIDQGLKRLLGSAAFELLNASQQYRRDEIDRYAARDYFVKLAEQYPVYTAEEHYARAVEVIEWENLRTHHKLMGAMNGYAGTAADIGSAESDDFEDYYGRNREHAETYVQYYDFARMRLASVAEHPEFSEIQWIGNDGAVYAEPEPETELDPRSYNAAVSTSSSVGEAPDRSEGSEERRWSVISELAGFVTEHYEGVQELLRARESAPGRNEAELNWVDLYIRLTVPDTTGKLDLAGTEFAPTVDLYRRTRDSLAGLGGLGGLGGPSPLPSIEALLQQAGIVGTAAIESATPRVETAQQDIPATGFSNASINMVTAVSMPAAEVSDGLRLMAPGLGLEVRRRILDDLIEVAQHHKTAVDNFLASNEEHASHWVAWKMWDEFVTSATSDSITPGTGLQRLITGYEQVHRLLATILGGTEATHPLPPVEQVFRAGEFVALSTLIGGREPVNRTPVPGLERARHLDAVPSTQVSLELDKLAARKFESGRRLSERLGSLARESWMSPWDKGTLIVQKFIVDGAVKRLDRKRAALPKGSLAETPEEAEAYREVIRATEVLAEVREKYGHRGKEKVEHRSVKSVVWKQDSTGKRVIENVAKWGGIANSVAGTLLSTHGMSTVAGAASFATTGATQSAMHVFTEWQRRQYGTENSPAVAIHEHADNPLLMAERTLESAKEGFSLLMSAIGIGGSNIPGWEFISSLSTKIVDAYLDAMLEEARYRHENPGQGPRNAGQRFDPPLIRDVWNGITEEIKSKAEAFGNYGTLQDAFTGDADVMALASLGTDIVAAGLVKVLAAAVPPRGVTPVTERYLLTQIKELTSEPLPDGQKSVPTTSDAASFISALPEGVPDLDSQGHQVLGTDGRTPIDGGLPLVAIEYHGAKVWGRISPETGVFAPEYLDESSFVPQHVWKNRRIGRHYYEYDISDGGDGLRTVRVQGTWSEPFEGSRTKVFRTLDGRLEWAQPFSPTAIDSDEWNINSTVLPEWLTPFAWQTPDVLRVGFAKQQHSLTNEDGTPAYDSWELGQFARRVARQALSGKPTLVATEGWSVGHKSLRRGLDHLVGNKNKAQARQVGQLRSEAVRQRLIALVDAELAKIAERRGIPADRVPAAESLFAPAVSRDDDQFHDGDGDGAGDNLTSAAPGIGTLTPSQRQQTFAWIKEPAPAESLTIGPDDFAEPSWRVREWEVLPKVDASVQNVAVFSSLEKGREQRLAGVVEAARQHPHRRFLVVDRDAMGSTAPQDVLRLNQALERFPSTARPLTVVVMGRLDNELRRVLGTYREGTVLAVTSGLGSSFAPIAMDGDNAFTTDIGSSRIDFDLLAAADAKATPDHSRFSDEERLGSVFFGLSDINDRHGAVQAQWRKLSQPKVMEQVNAMIARVPGDPTIALLKPLITFGPFNTTVPRYVAAAPAERPKVLVTEFMNAVGQEGNEREQFVSLAAAATVGADDATRHGYGEFVAGKVLESLALIKAGKFDDSAGFIAAVREHGLTEEQKLAWVDAVDTQLPNTADAGGQMAKLLAALLQC